MDRVPAGLACARALRASCAPSRTLGSHPNPQAKKEGRPEAAFNLAGGLGFEQVMQGIVL